ncbi:MAG: GreA/GreB family elongation factor [Patescibacteria group bacterium]
MAESSLTAQPEEIMDFGDWAKVKMPDGSVKDLTLVYTNEIDVLAGKISNESPIGRALLGAKAGEKKAYYVGERTFELEILEIRKRKPEQI